MISVIVTDLTDSTLDGGNGHGGLGRVNQPDLHVLESEIYRFGGEISQFHGDGLVAYFDDARTRR